MGTPLTDQQQELLSAWLDGEVTDAERSTVEALLKNPEGARYVEGMRATVALVTKHAPVRAPVGLSGRVLSELEAEFAPKAVGPGSEPFTAIPMLSWRAPLYAAAAAILVAIGIMFGPALSSPGTPTEVSRTPLDNLPDRTSEQPSPETIVEDARTLDTLDGKESTFREKEGVSHDFERMNRELEARGKWGKSEDASKQPELEKSRKELDEPAHGTDEELKNAADKDRREPDASAADPKPTEADKPGEPRDAANDPRVESEDSDAGEGGKTGRSSSGVGGGRGIDDPKKGNAETRGDDSGGGSGGPTTKKEKLAEPGAPERPALAKADDKHESAEEGAKEPQDGPGLNAAADALSIDISDAQSIAAQTDVLWVSSLYGDAELTDEDADLESVAVEIDAAKLPELLAALRRLAKDQGYGEVDGDGKAAPLADRTRGQGINGYLPADEAETPPEENETPPPSPKPEQRIQAEKVRIIIRLK